MVKSTNKSDFRKTHTKESFNAPLIEAYVHISRVIDEVPLMQRWATKRYRRSTRYETWTETEQESYKRGESYLRQLTS